METDPERAIIMHEVLKVSEYSCPLIFRIPNPVRKDGILAKILIIIL